MNSRTPLVTHCGFEIEPTSDGIPPLCFNAQWSASMRGEANGVQLLDRKALVSLLIHMTETTRVIAGITPHRASSPNSAHAAAHFAVDQGTQNRIIVIGHQTISGQPHGCLFVSLPHQAYKRGEILIVVKGIAAIIAPVLGMVNKLTS